MTMTKADLRTLGYVVENGKAVRAGDYRTNVDPKSHATPERPASPYRSKWEAERAVALTLMRRAGLIRAWVHEGIRLKLADGAWYKPDFMVWHNDGTIELEEVKGYWREAARVRWKVAVSQFPMFSFTLLSMRGGSWVTVEERCGGWLDIVPPLQAAIKEAR